MFIEFLCNYNFIIIDIIVIRCNRPEIDWRNSFDLSSDQTRWHPEKRNKNKRRT